MDYSDWLDSCCSCHICPPCSWCTSSTFYICDKCGEEFHDYVPTDDDEAEELGFVYCDDQEMYVPDPPMCSKCLSDQTLDHYHKSKNNKQFKGAGYDLLSVALNALNNEALKEAVLDEFQIKKTKGVVDIETFLNEILSTDSANVVIENWPHDK